MDSIGRFTWPANVVGLLRGKISRVDTMNIEHKTTPVEHWIVDGKAYRLATEADVGKECYFADAILARLRNGVSGCMFGKLTEVRINSTDRYWSGGLCWLFALIQDDSLLTPQRVPVPALGDGWYLLRDGDTVQAGDKFTTGSRTAWVDAGCTVGRTLRNEQHGIQWARYFGVTEPAAEETKPEPTRETAIDWTKPVRTKDGRAVRVLCTDGPRDNYPVLAIIDGTLEVDCWRIDGRFFPDGANRRDLENVPPEPKRIQKTWWMNVLESGHFYEYSSKEEAYSDRTSDILACIPFTIDCVEGEGLDVQP